MLSGGIGLRNNHYYYDRLLSQTSLYNFNCPYLFLFSKLDFGQLIMEFLCSISFMYEVNRLITFNPAFYFLCNNHYTSDRHLFFQSRTQYKS